MDPARLTAHDFRQVEAVRRHQHADQREAHRDLVGDDLRGRAQAAQERVLGVRRPAGEDDPVHADRRHRQHVEQAGGAAYWYVWPLFPLFVVYLVSGIAETNRHPFDVAEGESEIVAGFHVEYSGVTFALFFLAEYMNMILVAVLTATMFLGGWLSPWPGLNDVRIGPNRVGPLGLLQPFADVFKLIFKEIVVPTGANRYLFFIAPMLALGPALAAWAVVPFAEGLVLADINAGLLYILAMTSIGVYGIILAGWASNSKYAFLGCLRSAAQIVSYEIAMGFALVGVLMCASSLNLSDIVRGQEGGLANWYFIPLFPLFIVYFISGVAETNRHPFDVAEGESEIVAGFHVEYSGVSFALFFLAEYMNMIMISALTAVMFLGGWLSPWPLLNQATFFGFAPFGDGLPWMLAKMSFVLFVFLWIRATFPRYRYDQIMRLGWKIFIPVTLVWIVFLAAMMQTRFAPLFH